MTSRLTESLSLQRTDGSTQDSGGIPQNRMVLSTESSVKASVVLTGIGTSHVAVDIGTPIEDGLTYLKVRTADAIVQYGIVVAATFYMIAEITSDMGFVKLGIVPDSSDLYLKSDTPDSEVEIIIHKIVEASVS